MCSNGRIRPQMRKRRYDRAAADTDAICHARHWVDQFGPARIGDAEPLDARRILLNVPSFVQRCDKMVTGIEVRPAVEAAKYSSAVQLSPRRQAIVEITCQRVRARYASEVDHRLRRNCAAALAAENCDFARVRQCWKPTLRQMGGTEMEICA